MRILQTVADQLREPRGLLGKLLAQGLRFNREGIYWAVDLLQVQPMDQVLEVGFGPGFGIERLASLATQGCVWGVDLSRAMFQHASRRNARGIAEGRVVLKIGKAADLPFRENSVSRVLAANVVYFWRTPLVELKEIRRVLKPGGRLGIYFIRKEELETYSLVRKGKVYRLFTGEEVVGFLEEAGFKAARLETKKERRRTGICALAEK